MKQKKRLKLWLDAGMPADQKSLDKYGITMQDIKELEQRVMDAIHSNIYATRPDLVFADHETIQ